MRAPAHFEVELDATADLEPSQGSGYRNADIAPGPRPSARASIRWNWTWGGAAIFVLLVGLAGCVGLVLLARLFARLVMYDHPPRIIAIVLSILACMSVLGALALLWCAVAAACNSTRVWVADGILWVEHGPIPWPGGRRIYASDIEQLWCERYEYEVPNNRGAPRIETAFRLMVAQKRGEPVPLLDHLRNPEDGLYIEQLLEQALGIADTHVSGEIPRAP